MMLALDYREIKKGKPFFSVGPENVAVQSGWLWCVIAMYGVVIAEYEYGSLD